jgi:hypothetical protein
MSLNARYRRLVCGGDRWWGKPRTQSDVLNSAQHICLSEGVYVISPPSHAFSFHILITLGRGKGVYVPMGLSNGISQFPYFCLARGVRNRRWIHRIDLCNSLALAGPLSSLARSMEGYDDFTKNMPLVK